jgi:carboxypeptidase PM20D1
MRARIGVAVVLLLLLAAPARGQVPAREILARLVGFRTAAGHGQVPAMTDYIVGLLRAGGVSEQDVAVLPLGETLALLVRVPGRDAAARPLLFSAHMDVIDALPEDWERDPFTLVEESGYFFGRGTADNKAGVAAMVSAILQLRAADERPARTLVFAFIGDEETAMATTRLVAAHEWVRNAEYAINTDAGGGSIAEDGRPLGYWVQGAEKTYATFRFTVRNPGGHSSRPRPDNAIYTLAAALLRVRDHQFPVMSNTITRAASRASGEAIGGAVGELLVRFADDPADEEASAALLAIPDFAPDLSTTCVATMLDAGHAENALPQRAEALVNCRIFPGSSVDDVLRTLGYVVADSTVVIEVTGDPVASPVSEPREDVMAAITKWVHARHPGMSVVPYLESGGTDGLVYRNAGIPTWASSGIFMKSSDMFMHGLNERIPVAAFDDAVDHILFLVRELGGVERR